jgi:prepilin-type N-terminal cleavage/methylation domain-containing protein
MHAMMKQEQGLVRSSEQRCGRKASHGFTLVELMVVISIIAVLAAIIIPVAVSSREKAKQTECRSNLRAIAVAMRNYHTDNGFYPAPYDPVWGLGGISQLYISNLLSDKRALRCPDDNTLPESYLSANGITKTTVINGTNIWNMWTQNNYEYFKNHYSSYNQLFAAFVEDPSDVPYAPFPLYNYFGLRGGGGNGASANGNFRPTPAGTGASFAELHEILGAVPSPWTGVNYDNAGALDDTNYGLLMQANGDQSLPGWTPRIFRDDKHRNYAGDPIYAVCDRSAGSSEAKPLWDSSAQNIAADFPGLINRNAPDNTVITHCPWHRTHFGKGTYARDLVVRLDSGVELISPNTYDWVTSSTIIK